MIEINESKMEILTDDSHPKRGSYLQLTKYRWASFISLVFIALRRFASTGLHQIRGSNKKNKA